MKKIINYIFIVIIAVSFICSCTAKRSISSYSLTRYISSGLYNFPEYLTLYDNHIFVKEWTCCNDFNLGTWTKKNDTLILYQDFNNYISSSDLYTYLASDTMLTVANIPLKFIIHKDSIVEITDYGIIDTDSKQKFGDDFPAFFTDYPKSVFYKLNLQNE